MSYSNRSKLVPFSTLVGKTLTKIEGGVDNESVKFYDSEGGVYLMYHEQDCCESVSLQDVIGIDLQELVGDPVLYAHEESNGDRPDDYEQGNDSQTWTFYKISTIKGMATLRWLGQSNGYYSESVDFAKIA